MAMQQRGNSRGGGQRGPRPAPRKGEFSDRVLEIRRVTRVVAGGKRFSFRVTVVVGDHKGRVGVGLAKGLDVASAIQKAKRDAEKNAMRVELKNNRTIAHDVEAKYSAARVLLKPARKGNGLIAGGSVRTVLELLGMKDISAKILGRTTNKLTNAMATIEALKMLKTRGGPVAHPVHTEKIVE